MVKVEHRRGCGRPINVGPNNRVGSGARTREKVLGTAAGLVGGLPGGGGGRGSGPPMVSCRLRESDTTVFTDPGTGVSLRVGAREGKDGVTVFAKVERSPDSGTSHTAYVENAAGDQQAPARVGICDLWGEWKLTVSWTKTTYVDGQVVDRQSGGYQKSGAFAIPGMLSTADRPDGLWRRLGFSNASHGARQLALTYRVSPQELEGRGLAFVTHVTRPGQNPVTTVPFALRMRRGANGIVFEQADKTPCEEAQAARVGQAPAAIAGCAAAGR